MKNLLTHSCKSPGGHGTPGTRLGRVVRGVGLFLGGSSSVLAEGLAEVPCSGHLTTRIRWI